MIMFWFICGLLIRLFPINSCLDVTTTSSAEGTEGQPGVIRCYYSNTNPQDQIFVVLWQKFDDVTNKHVTIFNSQKYKTYPEKFVGSRFKPHGHASLQIDPLLRSDTGKYRCQVTPLPSFQQGESQTQLVVNYPPELTTPPNATYYLDRGDDVTLPCRALGVPNDLNYTWFHQRPGAGSTEVKIDVNLDKRGRYAKGNNLRIFDFTPAFEGKYECRVSNKVGSVTSTFQILLNRPVEITKTSALSMTIVEGDNVIMAVVARGIPNNVTYQWFYDDQPLGVFGWSGIFGHNDKRILPYLRISSTPPNGSKLEMIQVTRGISGNYSCVAWNGVGDPATVNATLDVTYEANVTTSPNGSYVIVEGHVLQIPCNGAGNPRPRVKWVLPSGMNMTSQGNVTGYDVGWNGTLTIAETSRRDSGIAECSVFNGIGEALKVETEIIVLFAPTIEESPQSHYYVIEGDDVTFPCLASSLPEADYSWYKGLVEVDSIYNDVTIPPSHLHISNVTSQHRGKYRCQAENNLGLVFAETELVVLFPAQIDFMTSHFETTVSSDVNITCLSRGFPLPSVQWLHSSFTPSIGIASVIRNGTRGRTFIVNEQIDDITMKSTLMLTRFGLRDFGTYYCTVVNKFDSRTVAVDVKSKDFPALPENVTISHVTQTSFLVTWSTLPNIPETKYFVQLRHMSDPYVTDIECGMTSCLMTSLNESTRFGVIIYGVNFVGEGRRSKEIFATTKGVKTTTQTTTTLDRTDAIPTTTTTTTKTTTTKTITKTTKKATTKAKTAETTTKQQQSTNTRPPPTTVSSRMDIYDVIYNAAQHCVRWKIDDVMEMMLTSSWNSSGAPRCVKIEIETKERSDWILVENCAPVWTEKYYFTREFISGVRLVVCQGIGRVCGGYHVADVIGFKEKPFLEPINTITFEADRGWLSAVVGASVAVSVVVAFYFVSFAFVYSRKKQMEECPFQFPHCRQTFIDDVIEARNALRFTNRVNGNTDNTQPTRTTNALTS